MSCSPPDAVGYCAPVRKGPSDCRTGNSGLLPIGTHGIRTLDDCAAWCERECARCNFVSFSAHPNRQSCEWHHRCAPHQLRWAYLGHTFCSRQVRSSPPPPPPRLPAPVPAGASPGYCALMGAGGGDCESDDQGSWAGEDLTFEGCIARCRSCAGCRFVSAMVGRTTSLSMASAARKGLPVGGGKRQRRSQRRHPPHWWTCRWYRHCDVEDLRQTPPTGTEHYVTVEVKPAAALSPPRDSETASGGGDNTVGHVLARRPAPIRLALVTLAMRKVDWRRKGGYDISCAMLQWCQNARRLQRALPTSWHTERLAIGVGEEGWINRTAGCGIRVILADPRITAAARACSVLLADSSARLYASQGRRDPYAHALQHFKFANMLKWTLLSLDGFDVVCFTDADLEMMPLAEAERAAIVRGWTRAIGRLLSSNATMVAEPDPQAPLNTGFMLLKPSTSLYTEGVAVLERCVFNRSLGWDHVGPMTSLDVRPLSLGKDTRLHAGAAAHGRLRATKAWRQNTWDFTSSDCDQGFFFYMLYVRHWLGAYAGNVAHRPLARHWWASFKPWAEIGPHGDDRPRTRSQIEQSMKLEGGKSGSWDPMQIARYYDYLVRMEEPGHSGPATSLLSRSQCFQSQRAFRQAIEGWSHFWEVYDLWQVWDGSVVGWGANLHMYHGRVLASAEWWKPQNVMDSHNGLFAADFQVPTLVQVFFVIHCLWTGIMGTLCTWDPSFSPITENGVFERQGTKEKFVHPNVRGAWSVRGGSMFLVTALALYFGTRETYIVAMAGAIWREVYDCVDLLKYKTDGYKIVLRIWMSPIGPMPPLILFVPMNLLAMWAILTAD